jgi:hypothetical protein
MPSARSASASTASTNTRPRRPGGCWMKPRGWPRDPFLQLSFRKFIWLWSTLGAGAGLSRHRQEAS